MERAAGSTSSTEPLRATPAGAAAANGAGAATAATAVAGHVVGAHGLRGELRVRCGADAREPLLGARRVTLLRAGEVAGGLAFEVRAAAPGRRGEVRLALAGVGRREEAEALLGRLVALDPAALEAPGPDEYYGYQLVGCRVERQDGAPIGRVSGIWPTGGADLLVVADPAGAEHLIPAARDLLLEVDLAGRRIVIDAIPGLIEGHPS
jgi:16S rRNA processing protein RimM